MVLLFPVFLGVAFKQYNIFTRHEDKRILKYAAPNDFNVLEFWEKELERIEAVDLNIDYIANHSITLEDPYLDESYTFKAQELYFDSPNWVEATPEILKLHGFILYPNNLNEKNPGCLCMHGLGNNANGSFEFALSYLKKGFIVLCHSHPGHGESEGDKASPQNFYFEGLFNESSHNYLTICGAIQAFRIISNLPSVNKSQIMVTGTSYGALNTMWLSGIYGDRIAGALPYVAVGDNKKLLEDPTKLLFWVWNKSASEFPDSFWQNQNLRVDPKYYLRSESIPPILWQIGTTDEFFHYLSINGTFDPVPHEFKYLQIYPNGHHGLFDYQNTTQYFIDFILKMGPEPPRLNIDLRKKEQNFIGNTLRFDVSVDSKIEVESIEVVYKYLNIIGQKWQSKELEKYSEKMYAGLIEPGAISSRVDYYFLIRLKGERNVWFSSTIYSAGLLHSNFTFFIIAMMIIGIAFPAVFLLRRDYKKTMDKIDSLELKQAIQKRIILNDILTITAEVLFFSSLFLPFVSMGVVTWTTIFLIDKIYTWEAIFGVITFILPYLILIIVFLTGLISLDKPITGGVLKLSYFAYMTLFYMIFLGLIAGTADLDLFNPILLGVGYYLILPSALTLIGTGIWNRSFRTRLNLQEK